MTARQPVSLLSKQATGTWRPGYLDSSELNLIISHIDSAKMYRNEKAVGDAVRESGVKRENIFISSYFILVLSQVYSNLLLQRPRLLLCMVIVIKIALLLSMSRLKISVSVSLYNWLCIVEADKEEDYIDLYLIHDPRSGKESRLEAYRGLLEAKRQGKVRIVGVSNL